MLGPEKEIIDNYVESGQVRIVYWPMLDHGNASLNAHAAADCAGRQSADAFWALHDQFYADQGDLWSADRAFFIQAAVDQGLDRSAFEECYDEGHGHVTVTELDSIRRGEGIFNRPTFMINGQLLIGSQPFEVFSQYIQAALEG